MKISAIPTTLGEYRDIALEFTLPETGEVVGTVHALARPVAYSPALAAALVKMDRVTRKGGDLDTAMSQAEQVAFTNNIARHLAESVKEWDLTDEDDEPIEPTFERISALAGEQLGLIFLTLQQALVAAPKGKQNS